MEEKHKKEMAHHIHHNDLNMNLPQHSVHVPHDELLRTEDATVLGMPGEGGSSKLTSSMINPESLASSFCVMLHMQETFVNSSIPDHVKYWCLQVKPSTRSRLGDRFEETKMNSAAL